MVFYPDMEKVQANLENLKLDHKYFIKKSTRKNKKVDLFLKESKKYLMSIGDNRYEDFTIHNNEIRRQHYKARHNKYRKIKFSRSWFSDNLLW
jgi:hypothetical protein